MSVNPHLQYPCQQCGGQVKGEIRRAPGPIQMGSLVMEMWACKGCQLGKEQDLEQKFWKGRNEPASHCGACGNDLGNGVVRVAHRALKEDGSWKLANTCDACFGAFLDIVQNNAKGE